MEVYSLNLAKGYVPKWGIKEGLREILANAYDESDDVTVSYQSPYAVIQNKGTIHWRHLTLGTSEKKDGAIGQFGEGLKTGALALVREDRHVEVVSDNVSCIFEMRKMVQDDIDVLFAVETDRKGLSGFTTVFVECTPDELDEAKALFVPYCKEDERWPHKLGPVKIYMRGVFVQTLQDGYADYNFSSREIVNRDRSVLDMYQIRNKAAIICLNKMDPSSLMKIIEEPGDSFEKTLSYFYQSWAITREAREKWDTFFKGMNPRRPEKVTYHSGESPDKSLALMDAKWQVRLVTPSFGNFMEDMGVSSIDTAYNSEMEDRRKKGKDTIPMSKMQPSELQLFDLLQDVAYKVLGYAGRIVIVEPNENFAGMSDGERIYIAKDSLESEEKALQVLIEEFVHHSSRSDDFSRGFQNAACNLAGKLARKVFEYEAIDEERN